MRYELQVMSLKPLNDRVVVKAAPEEQVTKGGILLPDTMDKERPEKGEIIAVGEGKLLDNGTRAKMSVKVGDTVMFKKYSPDEIKIDKEEYLVISESDILAIIE
jgi:chaperonin GroES